MIVAYGIQTYRRGSLPRIRLRNMYVEQTPTSRAQTALVTRPGLERLYTLGAGPIRGMFGTPGALNGTLFTVSGATLYSGETPLGTIAGSARVSMASSASQLLIANDAGLFACDGATVTSVSFPDGAGVSSVAFINGYFLAARTGTQRFYWSAILDGESWGPLDYVSAERSPDNIVAIWIVSDQVWIFGEVTTEVWISTGDGEIPFQRIDGRLYDQGCISRDTIAKLDNSIFWVGHDFKVYRGESQPARVSDHGIEQAIQESAVEDLEAWTFPWMGSLFYCLTTSSGTFAYNPATKQWNEFASWDETGWRAHIGVYLNGTVYAGDNQDGRIYRLEQGRLNDDSVPIERRWTVLLANPIYIDNIALDASAGNTESLTEQPIIEMRVSRDQGNTYGPWIEATSGLQGQYRHRIAWRRVGMIDKDGGLLDFRLTDETVWQVASIRMNESLAGRSR